MLIYLSALLIGIVAGLRAMTAPAVASWAARLGALTVQGTPLAFMAAAWTPWVLTLAALGELCSDKLARTPSRKVPLQFGTRLVTGAWSGATVSAGHGHLGLGLLIGALGALLGTLAGHRARAQLAQAFNQDWPAALIEDAVAVIGAVLIVFAVQA